MIENVQSKEDGMNTKASTYQGFRTPKNIKQIGENISQKKIYVEDYAFTYIKELVKREYTECKLAVLLGHYIKLSEERILLINGAVQAEGAQFDSENVFNNDTWTNIYESIKRYFNDVEVVGWYIGGPGFILKNEDKLKKIHLDNFAGVDKALLIYDSVEGEEAFYLFEHGSLNKQNGYYIYYDKNDDMQNYIVDHKPIVKSEKEIKEQVISEYKEEKQEKKAVENRKSILHLVYALASLMVVVIIVAFAAVLNNSYDIRELKKTVNDLSVLVASNEHGKDIQESTAVMAPDGSSTMNVETINGSLNSIKSEEVIGDKSVQTDESNDKQENLLSNENSKQGEKQNGEEMNQETPTPTKTQDTNTSSEGSSVTKTPKEDESKETANTEIHYYEVQKGDSLVGISFKLYNSGDYVTKIMELNGIEDMDKIYYGQKLIVP